MYRYEKYKYMYMQINENYIYIYTNIYNPADLKPARKSGQHVYSATAKSNFLRKHVLKRRFWRVHRHNTFGGKTRRVTSVYFATSSR